MPTARPSALRARLDALRAVPQPIAPSAEYEAGSGSGGSGTPDIVPATAVTELTSAHLEWLRPHFFLGGRWSASQAQQQPSEDSGDGGAPPVPLQLDRTTFCALLSKVLILGPRSMLAVFATVEAHSEPHRNGAAWSGLMKWVRLSVEAGDGGPRGRSLPQPCRWHGVGEELAMPLTQRAAAWLGAGSGNVYLQVLAARHLRAAAEVPQGIVDPMCVVWWNGQRVYETRTSHAHGTTEPRWNESVMLRIPPSGLWRCSLCVEVWHRPHLYGCGQVEEKHEGEGGAVAAAAAAAAAATTTQQLGPLGSVLLRGKTLQDFARAGARVAFHLAVPRPGAREHLGGAVNRHRRIGDADDGRGGGGLLAMQMFGDDPQKQLTASAYVAHVESTDGAWTIGDSEPSDDAQGAVGSLHRPTPPTRGNHFTATTLEAAGSSHPAGTRHRDRAAGGAPSSAPALDRYDILGLPRFVQPSSSARDGYDDADVSVGCQHPHMVDRLAVLEGHGLVASCCRDGIVRLWDAQSLQPAKATATVQPPTDVLAARGDTRQQECWAIDVASLELPPQGKRNSRTAQEQQADSCGPVVFLCADSCIRLWDVRKGWCPRAPPSGGPISLRARAQAGTLETRIGCVPVCLARIRAEAASAYSWSDVSNSWALVPRIVVGGADGTIQSFQCTSTQGYYNVAPQSRCSTKCHSDQVLCCQLATPYYLISGGLDANCCLSDAHRWTNIWQGKGHSEGVVSVDFNHQSQLIVSGGDDRRVILWDVSSGGSPALQLPKTEPVVCTSFTNHPWVLAVAYQNQNVRLWDVRMHPICLQEAIDKSSHHVIKASHSTTRYTAACWNSQDHSMLCAGDHAVNWKIRPRRPRHWLHLWKRRVQVLLVFLRWYAHHRKRGKVLAHEHALVIAEYVPALEKFVTVDVTGMMRYWRPDQDESAVIDSWVAEYHLLNACSSSEGTSDDLLTAAIVDSSSEALKVKLFSAQQSGSMSVHTMVGDEVHSTRLPSVPCEPTFLHYSAEHAPYSLLVRSRNGQAYLCDLSAIEAVKKLECPRKERVHDFATAACCATMSSIASTVLLSFQYLDAAGESVLHGFDRTSGRFNSALRSLRTPSQPDPHSTGARNYAYNPAIRQLLFIPSEKKLAASTAAARNSATSAAWTKQRGAGPSKQHNGLLVVVSEDGCCHLVDVEYLRCVQQFAANVGPGCVVGGWDSGTGMLIAGDYDGFAKLLRIDHHRGGDDQPWSAQSPAPPATGSSHLSVAHAWRAHVSAVTSVAAAPPRRFITGGADGSVMLWSARGEPLRGLGVTRAELWVLHWFRMDEPLRPVEPFREPPVGEMKLARRRFRTAIETISTTYKQQSARRMQRATVIHRGSIDA